jgi:hypothetical protein
MAKLWSLKTVIYALVFGVVSGCILAFGLSVFIPKFFPEKAGALVCAGKIEWVFFKQMYFCNLPTGESFALGDLMFWAVLKISVFPAIALGMLGSLVFVKAVEFLWTRRAAAGFE